MTVKLKSNRSNKTCNILIHRKTTWKIYWWHGYLHSSEFSNSMQLKFSKSQVFNKWFMNVSNSRVPKITYYRHKRVRWSFYGFIRFFGKLFYFLGRKRYVKTLKQCLTLNRIINCKRSIQRIWPLGYLCDISLSERTNLCQHSNNGV